ncbi:MAG: VTT domain-containing protein [Acidobacteria bacterium]|nr:VTT domain-containing protein [Acidobacteriota bacterium]
MNYPAQAIAQHGYILVFLIVLAEACGFPVPAALILVAAGAAAAAHILNPLLAVLSGLAAMMLGDSLLFFVGRHTGWALLGVLCRLSLNPETCILRSAESFYKRGRLTLVFSKFVPGLNTMAPPLAGTMKMKFPQFLQLDFLGASLYILAYGSVGYLFRDLLAKIGHGVENASHIVTGLVLAVIVVFLLYHIVQYARYTASGTVPRIAVEELARKLASSEKDSLILVDVRSHGYYDAGAARIAGSIRVEPNRLPKELENLPKDKDIYVYCT